jgi:YegS/Rv2252/BmrU family lipid kinase
MRSIHNILVLINPAAANNSGHALWARVAPRFEALFSSYKYQIITTQSREQSVELGASTTADLIISFGGDGTAHDITQGLMRRPRAERPALAVIPIGSGNDFAKTLGIPANPRSALEALSGGVRKSIDVGCCNGTVFLETLSFGVDAAIAHKTTEMRKTINGRGFLLYARAAVSAIIHELRPHLFSLTIDGATTVEKKLLICAIQNGPTYGGGFRIAPNARLDDNLLNICLATNTNRAHALYALTRISRGSHETMPIIEASTARHLVIELEYEVPAQYDGEPLSGTRFEIEVLPSAIDVIWPRGTAL